MTRHPGHNAKRLKAIVRLAAAALVLAPVAACAEPGTPSAPVEKASAKPAEKVPAKGKSRPGAKGGGAPSFFDSFDRLDARRWYVSDGWTNGSHQSCTWLRDNLSASGGTLRLIVRKAPNKHRSHGCAEIRTHARHGYGTYEARMRSAAGSGLNTAMFTYSGPPLTKVHDEVDFEFLGKNPQRVQLNYFVGAKGGNEKMVGIGSDLSSGFNTYAFEWLPGSMRWFINGKLVHSTTGGNLPSVPGQFFFSLWSGAPSVDGWLGRFDLAAGPTSAEIDWAAYTRPDERCRFPESITCAR